MPPDRWPDNAQGTWEPQPGWLSVPGGTGPSTVGVWRTELGGQPLAVKRLARPAPGDPAELDDPTHFAYWRREADVAESGLALTTPGLRGPVTAVEEDAAGITLTSDWVEDAGTNGLFVAHALGRFAAADLGDRPWLARDLLRRRIARVERRGGWPTLARTGAADLADSLWSRREHFLQQYDALPPVAHHGDVAAGNLRGRDGDLVVAIDWQSLGLGPVGTDLGLHMAGAREAPEPLLDAYLLGMSDGEAAGRRHRRPGAARRPHRGGVHRRQPRRVGAGPGRGRRGRARGQVPPPQRRAVPAGPRARRRRDRSAPLNAESLHICASKLRRVGTSTAPARRGRVGEHERADSADESREPDVAESRVTGVCRRRRRGGWRGRFSA